MADLTCAITGVMAATRSGPGGMIMSEQFVNFTLEVLAPPGWFLSIDPVALQVVQGDLAVFAVTAMAEGGYDSPLALSIIGLPDGVVATIAPPSIPPTGTATVSIPTGEIPKDTTLALQLKGVGADA